MEKIIGDESFSVGFKGMDKQHKQIINIINKLIEFIDPNFSIERWRSSPINSTVKDQKWLDSMAEMQRKAGLPD